MIERWSQGIADENMAEEILVDLGPIIRRHPWWRARAALDAPAATRARHKPPARILDAGCGWGVTLDALEQSRLPGDRPRSSRAGRSSGSIGLAEP